ncbi:MAG: DUF6134 family protein [Rhodospirillaceae bacterium]
METVDLLHSIAIFQTVVVTLTGKISEVWIDSTGTQVIQAQGATIQAVRYACTWEIETMVWYDAAGRWVKMMFKAQDGSMIAYRCRDSGLGD